MCLSRGSSRSGAPLGGGCAIRASVSIIYSEGYRVGLFGIEKLHPFDVNKYDRIARRLIEERVLRADELLDPGEIEEGDLLRVHSAGYLAELRNPAYLARALEVPLPGVIPMTLLDRGLLRPMRRATAGTCLAVRRALEDGIGINLGGGYHHAHPSLGHGFCLYADVGIALRQAIDEHGLSRVLIVDLDAHHGDGDAAVFREDDPLVKILDLYEANNFPYAKLPVWRKVEFGPGVLDEEYMEALERELPVALEELHPELVVYVAGVDVFAKDPLTRFELTREGIARRDHYVFTQVRGREIPLAMVLAGGYAPGAWEIQFNTVRWAIERFGAGSRAPA